MINGNQLHFIKNQRKQIDKLKKKKKNPTQPDSHLFPLTHKKNVTKQFPKNQKAK